MSKSNDNGRPKRSRNYKPYDANDSFIKRITHRVTDIIPRPSWVSKWMGSESSNADPRIDSSCDDEEDSGGGGTTSTTTPLPTVTNRSPPNKRMRLSGFAVNSTSDLHRHQNNVQRRTVLSDRHPGEISPILPPALIVSSQDRAEAGPSGLQNFRLDPNFVSSTPAVQESKPRDNLSETSESTSGCSSLVPQLERRVSVVDGSSTRRVPAEPRRLNITPTSSSNISIGSRDLTIKQKCPTKFSSSFSSPKPSFDSYVFNNPLSRSTNSFDEGSPFHRGRTLYGGASGYRRTLDGTLVSPLTMAAAATSTSRISPKVVSVQPSVSRVTGSHVSSSALRIFKALEQFSSPVQDSKKIPLKSDSERRKRKAIRPFEELVLPEMPDLLRIKRREDKMASNTGPSSKPSSTPSSSYQLPPPIQQLPHGNEESSKSDKRSAGIASKNFEYDQVAEVNLPKVDLPITTLPKFSFSLRKDPVSPQVPPPATAATHSEPASTAKSPGASAPTTPISRFKPLSSTTTLSPAAKVPSSSSISSSPAPARTAQFKFSNALDVEKNPPSAKLPSTDSKFKFCEPAPIKPLTPKNGTTTTTSTLNFNSIVFKQPTTAAPTLTFPSSSFPTAKLKSKGKKDETESSTSMLKTAPDVSAGSIDDFFNKSQSPVSKSDDSSKKVTIPTLKHPPPSENGDLSAFKPKTDTWECKECFVRNGFSRDKCEACGTAKATPMPNAVPAAMHPIKTSSETSLNALFKKPEGSWECKECFVSNKADSAACVACGTNKSGTGSTASSKPLGGGFQFGIPPAAASTTISSETKSFTFGLPATKDTVTNDTAAKTSSTPITGFTFGAVKPLENAAGVEKPPTSESADENLKSKKRVSFSEPPSTPFEERSMSVEDSSMPPVTEPPAPLPSADDKKVSAAFLFSSAGGTTIGKTSSFAPSSSTDSPASTAVSSSIFKFGSSSTGVSSSTDAAEPEKKGGFTFLANNNNNNTNTSSAPAATSAPWGAATGTTKVTFGAPMFPAKVERANNGASSTSEASGGLVLGAKRENPFGGVFGTEKKSLFESGGATLSQPTFNNSEESKAKPLFNSVVNSTPLFGASNQLQHQQQQQQQQPQQQQKEQPPPAAQAKPFTFGAASPFSFEASVAENKPPVNAFTFGSSNLNAAAPPAPPNNNNTTVPGDGSSGSLFGITAFNQPSQGVTGPAQVQPELTTAGAFCTGGLFNRTASKSVPIFGGSTASTAPSAAATPFTFGSSASAPSLETHQQPIPPSNPLQQAPQAQPMYSFSSQTQPSSAPFTFGAAPQNSVPTHQPPVQPPSFDPNIKPNFNFSGGSTPLFTAMPTGNPSELKAPSDRKFRRAVRRTQPR